MTQRSGKFCVMNFNCNFDDKHSSIDNIFSLANNMLLNYLIRISNEK